MSKSMSGFGIDHQLAAAGVSQVAKKRLTAAERKALPDSAFADPKNRRFPMEDKEHAANALARANQGFAGSKLKAKIKRKEEKMVAKSAFGIDHGEIAKASERRKRIRRETNEAMLSLPRKERVAAAVGSPFYTAAKAPKGKKLRAVKTQAREAFRTPLGGGRATARGYAKAKREWEASA
jgi:hypothetical protein